MTYTPFVWHEFIEGAITGFFFYVGCIFSMVAYETGKGGPINALICTQIVYQTSINALFFDQGISSYELVGTFFGILATIIICLWEDMMALCSPTEKKDIDVSKTDGLENEKPLLTTGKV